MSWTVASERRIVLLVDDALAVRGLARRILDAEGYGVLEASSGEEALQLAEESDRVDVLLTDFRLPGITGIELARRLAAQNPDLVTIYMSGYGEEALAGEELVPGSTFVAKPFSPVELAMTVRTLLDAPPT
jgi:two-component system, cell cycle sensor histidine kinase and response regulator CckA